MYPKFANNLNNFKSVAHSIKSLYEPMGTLTVAKKQCYFSIINNDSIDSCSTAGDNAMLYSTCIDTAL